MKRNAPMVLTVLSFIAFMNAESPEKAGLFGMILAVAIAWQIRRQRSSIGALGEPVFQLGRMLQEPPSHMRPWHMLAAFAFVLLGVAIFFSTGDANLPARLGMSLVTFAIVGTWMTMINKRLRTVGIAIFGLGFLLAGAMLVWEAVVLVNSGNEKAQLGAVRWSAFGACLLLVGMGVVWSLFQSRAYTAIYDQGVVGSQGLVPWEQAKRLELVESEGQSFLAVGTPRDWTLWIEVPDDQREAVAKFISTKTISDRSAAT